MNSRVALGSKGYARWLLALDAEREWGEALMLVAFMSNGGEIEGNDITARLVRAARAGIEGLRHFV